jgi:hypothetical protein
VEWLLRQNPLPLFISGRCGQTDVALLDADFDRTKSVLHRIVPQKD